MSSPVVNHPQQRSETPEHFRTQSHSQKSQAASLAPLITQKRVLPIRHRRGGPVIGNCHIDLLIIETEKRERESRPVIPPGHKFFLSTNVRLIPPLLAPEGGESSTAPSTSYFDKPEVKTAYLAQKAIQVPEYSPLPDDAVGGRLRARQDEEGYETSDMAYINRHRKYEAFEKRQRRREKEKLVHEQYKLKERIEQLKGMDVSAFGVGGETRRKEMLDTAIGLESRYAILLPPEPKKIFKKRERTRQERGKQKEDEEKSTAPSTELRRSTPAESRTQAVTVALEATVIPNESKKPSATFNGTANGASARGLSSTPPPRKRPRAESLSFSTPEAMFTQSVLLQVAARKAAQPAARQTGRSLTAFGFRVPSEVEEVLPTYSLPEWLITSEELERQYAERQQQSLPQGHLEVEVQERVS